MPQRHVRVSEIPVHGPSPLSLTDDKSLRSEKDLPSNGIQPIGLLWGYKALGARALARNRYCQLANSLATAAVSLHTSVLPVCVRTI